MGETGDKVAGRWKMWLVRAAWFVASLAVGALGFPLLFFAIFNPAALAIFAIVILGYGALLWSAEAARHRRMNLSRETLLHEMFIHGLAFLISLVTTAVMIGPGLGAGISM